MVQGILMVGSTNLGSTCLIWSRLAKLLSWGTSPGWPLQAADEERHTSSPELHERGLNLPPLGGITLLWITLRKQVSVAVDNVCTYVALAGFCRVHFWWVSNERGTQVMGWGATCLSLSSSSQQGVSGFHVSKLACSILLLTNVLHSQLSIISQIPYN